MKALKILIATFLLAVTLTASEKIEKIELNYKEQQEMLTFLKNKIKSEDYSSVFELGLVYEDGIVNRNNKKTPDLNEATRLYILAYEKGDYRSIFKLVPQLLKKKEYKEALKITQKAIDMSMNKRSLLISAVTLHSTMTIDYYNKDKGRFIDALYNISLVSNKELEKVPTLKFIKASIMNVVGDTKLAEKLLNEACFASNAPDKLKRLCFDTNNFEIVKNDVQNSIHKCSSCNIFPQ